MVNVNKKRNNVILGEKVRLLWGQPYITDKIGEISYQISPLSFLSGKSLCRPRTSLWKGTGICTIFTDRRLYGISTAESEQFPCSLHRRQRCVRGVEIVPAAIENAKENATLERL